MMTLTALQRWSKCSRQSRATHHAHPRMDFSTASVHIIPDDSLNREPREVITELLGHPSESIVEPPCIEP